MEDKGSLDNIELRSEEVQEILTKVPNWMIRWGNVLFLSIIFLLLLISWFVKYPDIIVSKALVTTLVPPQKKIANSSGKFDAILISDNDTVDVNQPLAIIENTANYEDVLKLQKIVNNISLSKGSFSFPLDSIPILFLGEIETTYAVFENNYLLYDLNKRLKPFSNELSANNYSISELTLRLKNLYLQKTVARKELSYVEKDLKRSKLLFEKGVIATKDYEDKQLQFSQAKRNYQNFESTISQLKESISNANRTSKTTEINRIKEELSLLNNTIQSFNQLKKVIKDWELRYVLKSDIKGVVSFLNVWSKNQIVNQGDLIFTVIPLVNSSFVAKLKTPIQNSGKIKLGQIVNIKLENYPDAEFGTLKGEIDRISLTPDQDENYLIDVKLPKVLVTSYKKKIEFKQEMIGVAEIITEDLRLIERFFYQLKGIFNK